MVAEGAARRLRLCASVVGNGESSATPIRKTAPECLALDLRPPGVGNRGGHPYPQTGGAVGITISLWPAVLTHRRQISKPTQMVERVTHSACQSARGHR